MSFFFLLAINESKTKTLIVAAGLGSRLKGHTENLPKCMLDFGGKTLLERKSANLSFLKDNKLGGASVKIFWRQTDLKA